MNPNQAIDVLDDLMHYYGKKLPKSAQEAWCRSLMRYSVQAANRALDDVTGSNRGFPTRDDVMIACHHRQQQTNPTPQAWEAPLEPWEEELAKEVLPFFMRYLRGQDSKEAWANNYRVVARRLDCEKKIDWTTWEKLNVKFYV